MKLSILLKQLWRGQLPLGEAFWRYTFSYNFMLNLAATIASLTLIVTKAPIALAIIVHFLPLPYAVLSAVGTWRSADRYEGKRSYAAAAKIAAIIWVCVCVLL